jgi:hypothetical protein
MIAFDELQFRQVVDSAIPGNAGQLNFPAR